MSHEAHATRRILNTPETTAEASIGDAPGTPVERPLSVMSQDGNRYPMESIRSLRAIESVPASDPEYGWEVLVELESNDGKDNPLEQLRRDMAIDEVTDYLKAFTVSGIDFVLVDNARRAISPLCVREYSGAQLPAFIYAPTHTPNRESGV